MWSYPLGSGFSTATHTAVEERVRAFQAVPTDSREATYLRPSQSFEMSPKRQAVSSLDRVYRIWNLGFLKNAFGVTDKC